ncbi:MAG: cyclic nucleotide-binding domain-containing protein [Desulfobaccales bacterium]
METIEPILTAHPFFRGLDPIHLKDLAACASKVNFAAGEFIYRAEQEATSFFLILQGRVSLEIFSARRGPLTLNTLEGGDVLGWLWFEEKPYQWFLDARAMDLTRALSLKVDCIRNKCESNHDLGFEIMKRYAHSLAVGFRAISLQLADMFQT